MKRSPITVKTALTAAVVASGLACAVPALATPYITIELMARTASNTTAGALNRYTVADGAGNATSLTGYIPTTGTTGNTTGYSTIITPSSVGQAYELLIRITLASQGSTNTFATGFTSIINW